LKQIA